LLDVSQRKLEIYTTHVSTVRVKLEQNNKDLNNLSAQLLANIKHSLYYVIIETC